MRTYRRICKCYPNGNCRWNTDHLPICLRPGYISKDTDLENVKYFAESYSKPIRRENTRLLGGFGDEIKDNFNEEKIGNQKFIKQDSSYYVDLFDFFQRIQRMMYNDGLLNNKHR